MGLRSGSLYIEVREVRRVPRTLDPQMRVWAVAGYITPTIAEQPKFMLNIDRATQLFPKRWWNLELRFLPRVLLTNREQLETPSA